MSLFFFILFLLPLNAKIVSDESLKEELHILTSSTHRSYSYKFVRTKMFNAIHLRKDANGYYVTGVYCLDKVYPFQGDHPGERLPDAKIMNTEHTWPQSKFSNSFNKETQKTDLHHLYPTLSRINSERGSYPFAEVYSERNLSCAESKSGSPLSGQRGTYFEPPASHKGNVARSLFYFSIRYKMDIDPVQENYLRRWHSEDPVDQEERKRNEAIFSIQKNRNPFIDYPGLVSRISDF